MRQQSIGIVSRSPRKSIVIFRMRYYLQGLNSIPHRIARELNHQFRTTHRLAVSVEQVFQRKYIFPCSIAIQQDAFSQPLLIAQYRQITLFAITEHTSICHHTNSQTFVLVRHFEMEGHLSRFSGLHHERTFLWKDDLFGIGYKDFHSSHTLHLFIGKVDERSRNIYLVSHPYEARKIGLQHEFLAGHHLVDEASVIHIFGMRQTHELPFGQTFWQGELDVYFAIGIRTELRIEEGSFGKIRAQLDRFRSLPCNFFFKWLLLLSYISHGWRSIFHFHPRITCLVHP